MGPVDPRGHINARLGIDSTEAWNAQLIRVGAEIRFNDEDRYALGRLTGYRLALLYNTEVMHPPPANEQFEANPILRKFVDLAYNESWRIVYVDADWSEDIIAHPDRNWWLRNDGEISSVLFRVAGDPAKIGSRAPVRFFIGSCDDNVLQFENGELPLVNTATEHVVVLPGVNSALCHGDEAGIYGAMGQIAITGTTSFTQGDIDLSGVSDVNDVVKCLNLLFRAQSVADPDSYVVEALHRATDVNRDEEQLTIADFDMLVNLAFRGLDTNLQQPPYGDTLYHWLTEDSAGIVLNARATAPVSMMSVRTDESTRAEWERLSDDFSLAYDETEWREPGVFLRAEDGRAIVGGEPRSLLRVRNASLSQLTVWPEEASTYPGTLMAIVRKM